MEPDFEDAQAEPENTGSRGSRMAKAPKPDKADVFTGSISMPEDYREVVPEREAPAYSTNLPEGADIPPEPEDDYDLEAAAKRLTPVRIWPVRAGRGSLYRRREKAG